MNEFFFILNKCNFGTENIEKKLHLLTFTISFFCILSYTCYALKEERFYPYRSFFLGKILLNLKISNVRYQTQIENFLNKDLAILSFGNTTGLGKCKSCFHPLCIFSLAYLYSTQQSVSWISHNAAIINESTPFILRFTGFLSLVRSPLQFEIQIKKSQGKNKKEGNRLKNLKRSLKG